MASKPPKLSRNHHFVPRSVLRRFSIRDERQQVCVFDKRTRRHFSAGLSGAGSENDYNTLLTPAGEVLNFEDAFDDIDSMFAEVGDSLHQGRSLAGIAPAAKATLADSVVVQLLRTPIVRSTFQSIPRQLADTLVALGSEPPVEEELPTENDARLQSLKTLANRDDLCAALVDKDLILLEPAGKARFWTSDNPVACRNDAPNGNVGVRARGVQIYMPIASDLLLGFLCPSILKHLTHIPLEAMRVEPRLIAWRDGILLGTPVKIEDALIEAFNIDQAHNCQRFIYSARDDFARVDCLKTTRERDSVVTMSSMGNGLGPSHTVPEGQWLALYGRERTHIIPMIGSSSGSHGTDVVTDLPTLLDDILLDRPFKSAEFYVDRHLVRMIGGGVEVVVLERVKSVRFQVVHSDPSLQALDELLGRP